MENNRLINQGYKLVGQKSIAKITRSWQDKDGLHFKEEVQAGTPQSVKESIAPKNNGERDHLEYAHTTKVFEKIVEKPNTDGTLKERETVIVQSHSLDDDGNDPGQSDDDESMSEDLGGDGNPGNKSFTNKLTDYLKNMIDNLELKIDSVENRITLIFVILVLMGILIGIAIALHYA